MKIFMFCQTVHPDFPIFLHGYIRPICDISQLCLFLWRISNHQNLRYSKPISNSIRRVSSQSNRGCLSARQGVTSRQFARNLSVAPGQPMVAPGQPMQWLLLSNQLVTNQLGAIHHSSRGFAFSVERSPLLGKALVS